MITAKNSATRNPLDTNLVVARFGDVSNPSVGVVTTLIVDSKETHMDTTSRKHGNLEFCIDGRSAPWLWSHRGHQIDIGLNVTLGLAWESLDTPNDSLLFWFVLCSAKRMLDFRLCRVLGHRYLDDDMSGKQLVREISNHFQVDRDPVENGLNN